MDLEAFAQQVGHRFHDPALLRRALTHRSHGSAHNERLEFLGDSVLNCAIALELYRRFPQLPEGELSRLRAHLVNQDTLSTVARRFGVGAILLLGEGELRSGGCERPSILADAVEAVVGAVFLDGGYDAALGVVQTVLGDALANIDPAAGKDPKTTLQEHLQARRISLPRYAVVATRGAAHRQEFEVECVIPELGIRTLGEGSNRRSAEQHAARLAYERATRE
ncbi:MAG: ribonuclease III [Betaproteobacteria bacterium RIFCSPLOWO2_02_64_14]|nr:MAG: ribonuclease III [Betaproteobacteria bacterium RIFCSPLOWO2_02_64_14]